MKRLIFLFWCLSAFAVSDPVYAGTHEDSSPGPGPVPDSRVLVFFVDSLRPDITDKMVAEGLLPNIKRLFYGQGLRFENCFTIFPSLTVAAYAAFLTGNRPDRSGFKAMSYFERFPTRKQNIVKRAFGIRESFPRYYDLMTDREKAPEVLKQNGAKTLYDHLGEGFHSTIVPIIPMIAPQAWPHLAANEIPRPYAAASEVRKKLDEINAKYALRYMVTDPRAEILLVWFSELDSLQHRSPEGQSGEEARSILAENDRWIGTIYDALVKESGGRKPYVVLFSDHGAYGGENGVYNQPYHLGHDFFYRSLKMNARGPDYSITHPGTDPQSYAYADIIGSGQARIFLPVADGLSGNWDRPNTLRELANYGLGPNRRPVNLIRELMELDLTDRNVFPGKVDPRPVDLAFIKISKDLVYVIGQAGSEALIFSKEEGGRAFYRYLPVRNVLQNENRELSYEESSGADPFGYLTDPGFKAPDVHQFIREFREDREWLEATCKTAYPDAVSAIARVFMWRPELEHLARSRDPDIWLSAKLGWSFRIDGIKGTDHGPLLRTAMRSTLMISGPNIRAGTDPAPRRIVEIAPTLLQMAGYKKRTSFETGPIEGIYEG